MRSSVRSSSPFWLSGGLFLLLPIVGCGGVPETHYYLLDYPLNSATSAAAPFEGHLGVLDFTTTSKLQTERIVYRPDLYKVGYYEYHQWATPLASMITERLTGHLRAANLFQRVEGHPFQHPPALLLRGHIREFEEVDQGERWTAVSDIEFLLEDAATGEVWWRKSFRVVESVNPRNPVGVVEALSRALKKTGDLLVRELEPLLASLTSP